MSGIAGIIHFDGVPVGPGQIEQMTSAMAHRGPDGINHWIKGSVALGQCMLCTTPESLEEIQPLTNEDENLVLVMDGRVDNWEELRKELVGRGTCLRNRSDAELVLRAYETWSKDCLAHIDGDFAFVIWDTSRKTAFCARDQMGNKPFNYCWDGKTLVFASDLHAVFRLPWLKQVPNEGMLAEYLAAEWYSVDETLWVNVMRLPAAHRMEVSSSGMQLKQYWEPDLWETLPYTKDEEYFEHYRDLMADTVRRLSRSHRRLAIEVSGGLDSSAVLCMAEHLRKTHLLLAPDIEGYTLAFCDDSAANELTFARSVGEYLGLKIREVPASILPLSWYAERAQFWREFPGYPNGLTCVGLLEQASTEGCRVVLTGQGGDHWLQGSRVYYAEELAQGDWQGLCRSLRADAKAFGNKQAIKWLIRSGLLPLLPQKLKKHLRRLVSGKRGRQSHQTYWLSPEMQKALELRREHFSPIQHQPVKRYGQRELLTGLDDKVMVQVLERFEREGAIAGLEIRHPFWNRRFVQFAFSTPEKLRRSGDITKVIHRRALQEIMPKAILERKCKAEFSSTFHRHLDQMRLALTETVPQGRTEWLATEGMVRLFADYQDDPQISWRLWVLWGIYGCDKVY